MTGPSGQPNDSSCPIISRLLLLCLNSLQSGMHVEVQISVSCRAWSTCTASA